MEQITFNFPFQKVNKDKRIVTGIATAENIDQSGDIVKYNGSLDAFSNWVGNIREMHGKEAVGKALGYTPVIIEDQGKRYRGIQVDAYISKGAPNTWEKILDGTLQGFSIGGNILKKSYETINGVECRAIEEYSLGELSLVDNPDNPLALFSMVKRAADGTLEFTIEKDKFKIFYCAEHKISKADSNECGQCETPMVEIGFTEEFSVEEVTKMINAYELKKGTVDYESNASPEENSDPTLEAVCPMCGGEMDAGACTDCEYVEPEIDPTDITEHVTEKGIDLQNNNSNDSVTNMELSPDQKVSMIQKFMSWLGFGDEEVEKAVSTEVKVEAVEETKEIAKEEVVEKDGGSEVDINEITSALSAILDEKLTKVREDIETSVQAKIDEKVEAITKSVTEVAEKVETVSASVTEVSEKVETIDETSAVKKSVDKTEDETDKVEKTATPSFWGNVFVPREIVEVLGYES